MGCACFGFNEWWFEILLPCYWLEVVGLFSSDLWHHLVCKWSIYTHLFILALFLELAATQMDLDFCLLSIYSSSSTERLDLSRFWLHAWKVLKPILKNSAIVWWILFSFLIFTCISCWQWKREVFCLDVFTVYATDLEKLVISPQC